MDWRRMVRSVCAGLAAAVVLSGAGEPRSAEAAWLRPAVGTGNFSFACDLVTLIDDAGQRDVVVTVAVPHSELTFRNDAGLMRARVRATVRITAHDGRAADVQKTFRLAARSEAEARTPTLSQVFNVILEDVPFDSGDVEIRIEDLNRSRGPAILGSKKKAMAKAVADWYAPPSRSGTGLSVGEAVFMEHAPIRTWAQDGRRLSAGGGGPWGYVNPARRYGLECEALQLYFTLEPPALVEDRRRAASRDLRVEISSEHLDFALRDTIRLTAAARRALVAGRPAAVYWEMDAGGLPPGAFRLGIAPLDTTGRGLLTGFDMVWRLDHLARPMDDILGEGRTVFQGDELRHFEASARVEQQIMLEAFWDALDPSPEDPYNEARAEFARRVSYVRTFLGGFDENGAGDPRGRLYIILGEPDSIREEALPMNDQDLNDARIMVYDRYAPERLGSSVRGKNIHSSEEVMTSRGRYAGVGAIPMPYSYLADKDIKANLTASGTRAFQLWRYDDGGDGLFLNSYTGMGGGLRFLFVDKTGKGDYVLDSDNSRFRGD